MEHSATPGEISTDGLVVPPHGIAFAFPGDGSYDGPLFRELYAYLPYLSKYFYQADDAARRVLRQPFLPLVELETLALHDQRLERCPDLAHLGIVLTGVLVAESLQEQGVRPDLLVGDGGGIGEIAALAASGSIEVSTALRIAAERAVALRSPDARPRFAELLRSVQLAPPRVPVLARRHESDAVGDERLGALGVWRPVSADVPLAALLSAQRTSRSDLEASIAVARAVGCEHVVACAPGEILRLGSTALAAARAGAARRRQSVASGIASVAATMRRTVALHPIDVPPPAQGEPRPDAEAR